MNATLERQVEEYAAQVQEVTQELESLVTAVIREMDAPLRHIRAFAGPLRGEAVTAEDRARATDRIVDAADGLDASLRAQSCTPARVGSG